MWGVHAASASRYQKSLATARRKRRQRFVNAALRSAIDPIVPEDSTLNSVYDFVTVISFICIVTTYFMFSEGGITTLAPPQR